MACLDRRKCLVCLAWEIRILHDGGAFEVGNYFMMKPQGFSAVKIMLTHVEKEKTFTDCTTFIGAKMYDTHTVEETPQGIRVTNIVMVTGPLQWLWTKLVAQNVAASIPEQIDALIKRAQESNDNKV